jgi:hypothetical protein
LLFVQGFVQYLLDKSDPVQVTDLCYNLYKSFGHFNCVFWCDGADRGTINLLKSKFGESLSWESNDLFGRNANIKVRPVLFNRDARNMLNHLYLMVTKGYLAIEGDNPKFSKLLTSMRTCYANEWDLDKRRTLFSDLLDGLRLALKGFELN